MRSLLCRMVLIACQHYGAGVVRHGTANNDGYMGITLYFASEPGHEHSLTETWMMHSATSQAILTPLGEGTNTSLS